MEEIFKDIDGYEGIYAVSNYGRVYNCKRKRFLSTPKSRKKKYVDIVLTKDGISKSFKVHRLVATAFIPNPNNYPIVNHKDEDPTNNMVDNLEWCTNRYNLDYGSAHERQAKSRSVLKEEDIKQCEELFDNGFSITDISKLYGVSGQTISRAMTRDKKYNFIDEQSVTYEEIRKNGIEVAGKKHRKLSDEDILNCLDMYENGEAITLIAKRYNVSIATISNTVNKKTERVRRVVYGQ